MKSRVDVMKYNPETDRVSQICESMSPSRLAEAN